MNMKHLHQSIISGCLCILLGIGCTETDKLGGEGTLRMTVSVDPYVNTVTTRALTDEEQEELENDCEIRIYSGKGLIRYYQGISQMPEALQLTSGSYSVRVTAGDSVAASFEDAYYKGMASFEITAGSVTNQEVACTIANVLAAVDFGDNIDELFKEYTMAVSTTTGSLDFTQDNIGAVGYYMLSEGDSSLDWAFAGTLQNGKSFSKEGSLVVSAATRYDFKMNFTTDGYEDGGAALQVTVQETPLETVEDNVEIKQRPSFRGVGFDFASPYMYALGATDALSFSIAVTSELTAAGISCEQLTEWGFDSTTLQLVGATEEELSAWSANGLQLTSAFDETTKAGLLTVTFASSLIQQMTTAEATYAISVSATDAEGLSNTATLTIVVSNAYVLTTGVDEADVWTSTAVLQGEVITETTETLSFNYRKSGETVWQNVAAVRNDGEVTFTAELTGLEAGTTYEYQAMSGETPSAVICTFTTETAEQLPNSGFENWSGSSPLLIYGSGDEMFWDSGNHGSATLSKNVTTYDTSIVHGGTYSAKLQSQFVGVLGIGKFAAGNLFAGKYLATDGTDGVLGFGRDFASRPTALHGYVRYVSGTVDYSSDQIASGAQDQGIIYIALGDWEKTQYSDSEAWPVIIKTKTSELFDSSESNTGIIAYGEQVYYSSTDGSGMVEFTINLDYRTYDRKPTSIIIVASASRYGDYFSGSTGSTMWLDDLDLIYE